jgi:hypothetical protein
MSRLRVLVPALVCVALGVAAAPAGASGTIKLPARVGHAMGLVPHYGVDDIAAGSQIPEVYHAGSVMRGASGVTVHTIFWAPSGFEFHAGYKALIHQFFTDVASASGGTANVFSVLPQFADGAGPGQYKVKTDSIDVSDQFPAGDQCASANGVPTCLTDHQVQNEVDHVIQASGGTLHRGLGDLYMVFLPQDVDTCITPGVCGTNAFGGYHAISDVGHGTTIYANIPDPTIEGTLPDTATFPQGNPDAEIATDVAAHETVEAITDPLGTGWMDPNGFEVADKCEFGPLHGTALGQAPNGADFNQLINGHQYLIQEMWSNDNAGCVQRSTQTGSPLPLAQVNLSQFGTSVTGNVPTHSAVGVTVAMIRAGDTVATASTTASAADGSWHVTLGHAVGDDRDEIDVSYTGAGAPANDTILTGNGGDPNNEAGWTGWGDLDTGVQVASDGIAIFPCFQVGVFAIAVNGARPPVGVCDTESDVSATPTAIGSGDNVTVSTNDNRAFSPDNPNGALVDLSIRPGEPNAAGFPACTADLETATVDCAGLVPGAGYALKRSRGAVTVGATAGDDGSATAHLPGRPGLRGGDSVTVTNAAHRVVTTLHIAQLRVDIQGSQTVTSSGHCQPGDYYGAFTIGPSTSDSAGGPGGPAGTGIVCPAGGDAGGLPTDVIAQTDDASGGQTQTEVPDIEDTSPLLGAITYGRFTAVADAGLPGPDNSVTPVADSVSVSIKRASGGALVFRARNVNTVNGVPVRALTPGTYAATWKVTNQNGDTRTVHTRFVEEPGNAGSGHKRPRGRAAKVACRIVHVHVRGKVRTKVRCKVAYAHARKAHAVVRVSLSRGRHVAALGHARLRHGRATVMLRPIRKLRRGRATITLVAKGLGTTIKTVRLR